MLVIYIMTFSLMPTLTFTQVHAPLGLANILIVAADSGWLYFFFLILKKGKKKRIPEELIGRNISRGNYSWNKDNNSSQNFR